MDRQTYRLYRQYGFFDWKINSHYCAWSAAYFIMDLNKHSDIKLQRNVGGGRLAHVGGGAWLGTHGQLWTFKELLLEHA